MFDETAYGSLVFIRSERPLDLTDNELIAKWTTRRFPRGERRHATRAAHAYEIAKFRERLIVDGRAHPAASRDKEWGANLACVADGDLNGDELAPVLRVFVELKAI